MTQNLKTLFPQLGEWRTVAGFENYEISNLGEVRNKRTQRILKNVIGKDEYLRVSLYTSEKKLKNKLVHRLVAEMFLTIPEHLQEFDFDELHVNHLDKFRGNCKSSNLEICTVLENHTHKNSYEKVPLLSLEVETEVIFLLKKYKNKYGQIALLLDIDYLQVYAVHRNMIFDNIIRNKILNK